MGLESHDQPGDNTFRVGMTAGCFEASMVVEMGTQDEVAAQFPKSYKVYGTRLKRWTYRSLTEIPAGLTIEEQINHPAHGTETIGYVCIKVWFEANGVNGGINETGKARARKFLAKAEALGYQVEWFEPGQQFGQRARRDGFGDHYTVGQHHLTKAQGLELLA
jgi:hypothetical protein